MKIVIQSLNKLFNLKTHEWPWVLFFITIAFLTNGGGIWGVTVSYASFLQVVGVESLPWVLMARSILSVFLLTIYTAFADRIRDDVLLSFIFLIEGLGIALGIVLIWFDLPALAFPLLYTLALSAGNVVFAHEITYFNNFYDTQTAKRILPIISSGYRVGAIVAGLTVPLFNLWFNNPNVIVIAWFIAHIMIAGLIWVIPPFLKGKKIVAQKGVEIFVKEKKQISYIQNIREGFEYTVNSKYLRWMALDTFFMMFLLNIVEYRTSEVLLGIYDNVSDLSDFTGTLLGSSNIVILPILLFGLSRLIAKIGLDNAILLFPGVTFFICLSLVIFPGLTTASAAYLDRSVLLIALYIPVNGLLYNAVPLRVKGRARAFVSGLVSPLGSLVGSSILLIPGFNGLQIVSFLLVGLSVIYLSTTFIVRKQYGQALINLLKQEDYASLLSRKASEVNIADPATLNLLVAKLEENNDPEMTVFIAQLISQGNDEKATTILTDLAQKVTDPAIQASILQIMVATNLRGNKVQQLYTHFLNHHDGRVRQFALAGLENLLDTTNKTFHQIALKAMQDADDEVKIQALIALARSNEFYLIEAAMQVIEQMLNTNDRSQQMCALSIAGQINQVKAMYLLMKYLNYKEDAVRLEAIIALEGMPDDLILSTEKLVSMLVPRLEDPIQRIRVAALQILARINEPQTYPVIVERLTDNSFHVQNMAVNILVALDKTIVPIMQSHLQASDIELRKMAAIILSRVNKREFGALIIKFIEDNLVVIYRQHTYLATLTAYQQFSGIVVLINVLEQQNQKLIQQIFYLLSGLHKTEAIEVIVNALENQSERIRANALEALETLTNPQIPQLMGPLFDPSAGPKQLLKIAKQTWKLSPPTLETIINNFTMVDSNPWLRAITIFTLGELGEYLRSEEFAPPVDISENTAKKTKRVQLDNVFNILDDEDIHTPSKNTNASNPSLSLPFNVVSEILEIVENATYDPEPEVRLSAKAAERLINGLQIVEVHLAARAVNRLIKDTIINEERFMLSAIEKIIFLKRVPFFQGMTVDQLKTLATVCEEELFEEDTTIFQEGDPGGSLYVIISGKVGLERQTKRKTSSVRLTTIGAYTYFGEMNLFDNSPRTISAIALQDTLTLRVRHEPLVALARQYPGLSLELIKVLSGRLREANDQIAALTRSKPRQLHKLFDQYE